MSSLVVVVLLFAALFVTSFITKRRFGVLGLALAAGALLSENWAGTLTPFIEKQGFSLVTPPLSMVVAAGLTLAPAVLLLFSGPTYSKSLPRTLGSLAFALLSMTFLLPSIGGALQLDGLGLSVYKVWKDYQSLIIVAGLILALVDVLLTRRRKDRRRKGER